MEGFRFDQEEPVTEIKAKKHKNQKKHNKHTKRKGEENHATYGRTAAHARLFDGRGKEESAEDHMAVVKENLSISFALLETDDIGFALHCHGFRVGITALGFDW